ncbi:non-heme iron oxygenase ferredoxin subunit [Muricoccus vinaceus]|uniref:Non-heme iron oxygenase ferredoxin subunit n=1 Tax=Muricoccus vinaceus TaxID=424704 RepID=A0ABV6IPW5_9PROT
MTDEAGLEALCDASDVEEDTPVRAELRGEAYAVFLVEGRFYVTQDLCTHGPGSLSEGFVEGSEIECPFHQGKFDIRTGAPAAAPCTEPLRTWPAQVVDGKVCIDPAKGRRAA